MVHRHELADVREMFPGSLKKVDILVRDMLADLPGKNPEDWIEPPPHFVRAGLKSPRCGPWSLELWEHWRDHREPSELYGHPGYFYESLKCSLITMRGVFLAGAQELDLIHEPKRIVDFGAGQGVSTVIFALLFPDAEVWWSDCQDCDAVLWLADRFGASNVRVGEFPHDWDVLLLFEVVEHLGGPARRVGSPMGVDNLLERTTELVVHSTAWTPEPNGQPILGHFLEYEFDGDVYDVRKAARAWSRAMERRGWDRIWKGWNGQPAMWERTREEKEK